MISTARLREPNMWMGFASWRSGFADSALRLLPNASLEVVRIRVTVHRDAIMPAARIAEIVPALNTTARLSL